MEEISNYLSRSIIFFHVGKDYRIRWVQLFRKGRPYYQLVMTSNYIRWGSGLRVWDNVKYLLFGITTSSTLNLSRAIFLGPIYESKVSHLQIIIILSKLKLYICIQIVFIR